SALALLLVFLIKVNSALAETKPQYFEATIDGKQYRVRDNRRPALYTADFGDCLGQSLINVTRFDAAYYRDNMTVLFHLEGETALTSEDIMMSIGVFAYGASRFELTFNPCSANINSACPAKAGVPIEAEGIIPVNKDDVAAIPDLALNIPDFEGQAILRIFSNSTQAEIGCFAAQITNGNTFRQKTGVGAVLGALTLLAVLSSFATAVYGEDVIEMRQHYAHSISVMAVFAVWHHIYFTGAMSMNWPNVLVAFWSNYAWSGGMIYSEHMQNTINEFIGSNKGNTSHVGAAGTGVNNPDLGGGYDIHAIYRRASGSFSYTGQPVKPGLPLPGNFSGFAGTLSQERIPASNAFMTCLLWSLILVALMIASILAFKITLEGFSTTGMMKKNRLKFFRNHWFGYTVMATTRAIFIGFFMLIFVAMFQFSYLKSPNPVSLAGVVFLVAVFGIGSAAGATCYARIKSGKHISERDTLMIEKIRLWPYIPWFKLSRRSTCPRSGEITYIGSIPWFSIQSSVEATTVHHDDDFIKWYGFLVSRYRPDRWWFFVIWLIYEFIRACFLAGALGQPLVQVFGLLAVEITALVAFFYLHPFEGQRLNILLVYLLGFSKVTTTALSAAFDTHFNLPRIPATIIGIIIIVIQGLLTIVVMGAIIRGAVTSYFSVMRNREQMRPRGWMPSRNRYLQRFHPRAGSSSEEESVNVESTSYLAQVMEPVQAVPNGSYFRLNQIQRVAKVEDDDAEFLREIHLHQLGGTSTEDVDQSSQRSRAISHPSQASYTALPRAARLHRPNWTSRDFSHPQNKGRARTLSNT
ncbi:hypothetical protein BDU57DRAFT_416277, partial [Ampelomyces quisqualis]